VPYTYPALHTLTLFHASQTLFFPSPAAWTYCRQENSIVLLPLPSVCARSSVDCFYPHVSINTSQLASWIGSQLLSPLSPSLSFCMPFPPFAWPYHIKLKPLHRHMLFKSHDPFSPFFLLILPTRSAPHKTNHCPIVALSSSWPTPYVCLQLEALSWLRALSLKFPHQSSTHWHSPFSWLRQKTPACSVLFGACYTYIRKTGKYLIYLFCLF
jgi:hypothetical protein